MISTSRLARSALVSLLVVLAGSEARGQTPSVVGTWALEKHLTTLGGVYWDSGVEILPDGTFKDYATDPQFGLDTGTWIFSLANGLQLTYQGTNYQLSGPMDAAQTYTYGVINGGDDGNYQAYRINIAFAPQLGVAPATVIYSNTITAKHMSYPVSITACTSTSCEYRVGSGAWTSAPGTALPEDVVQVRQTSSSSPGTTTELTLTMAGLPTTFTVTTGQAPTLSTRELSHGSAELQDLAAQAGPVADVDHYRLAQAARCSYEVVVDAASGDVQPLVLERLAADTTTVLASSIAVGMGSSRSLRWENPLSASVLHEYIRVRSGGCTTTCGSQDVYRIRAYETTYTIPRFNNSGTQATVLILQNPASYTIGGTVYFWSGDGALLHAQPVSIAPHGAYALNTSTIPALQGRSGTVTVANDGRYGDLAGTAVALEQATGFSFDSPMVPRPVR